MGIYDFDSVDILIPPTRLCSTDNPSSLSPTFTRYLDRALKVTKLPPDDTEQIKQNNEAWADDTVDPTLICPHCHMSSLVVDDVGPFCMLCSRSFDEEEG